jgi:hypothetical protein
LPESGVSLKQIESHELAAPNTRFRASVNFLCGGAVIIGNMMCFLYHRLHLISSTSALENHPHCFSVLFSSFFGARRCFSSSVPRERRYEPPMLAVRAQFFEPRVRVIFATFPGDIGILSLLLLLVMNGQHQN